MEANKKLIEELDDAMIDSEKVVSNMGKEQTKEIEY